MPMQISISNSISGKAPSGGGSSFASTNSFTFDGNDDYIDCGDNNNLSFGNGTTDSAFSISAWVKMTDATRFRVVSKLNGSNAEYGFFTSASDQLYFVLYDNTTSNRISRFTSSALTSYQGTWIHLAATYSGSGSSGGLKIYLDNSRIDDLTSNVGVYTAMHNTSAFFEIGKYTTSSANGLIDEVAVFNSELSGGFAGSDITTIYNSGIPNDLSSFNPISWWRMGEAANYTGREWVLTDQGSRGNDGFSDTLPAPPAQPSTDVPT